MKRKGRGFLAKNGHGAGQGKKGTEKRRNWSELQEVQGLVRGTTLDKTATKRLNGQGSRCMVHEFPSTPMPTELSGAVPPMLLGEVDGG
eukprot:380636-Pelagomonas_calceolata.AAC.14